MDALRSLHVGGKVREQEVLTPEWILDAARTAMGDILIDPCAHHDPNKWFAKTNLTLSRYGQELQRAVRVTEGEEQKALQRELDLECAKGSLALDWSNWFGLFVNPPYSDLKPWMGKASTVVGPCVQLVPVRTHRTWWIKYARGLTCVFLAPFPFVGSKSSFPAPMCLLSNVAVPDLGKRETGRAVL